MSAFEQPLLRAAQARWAALRPGLRWALGLALAGSAASILLLPAPEAEAPPRPHRVTPPGAWPAAVPPPAAAPGIAPEARSDAVPNATPNPAPNDAPNAAPGSRWLALLRAPGAPLEPPEGDPFAMAPGPSAVAAPAAPANPTVAPPPPAAPPPVPPAQPRYRVVGWLQTAGAATPAPASEGAPAVPGRVWLLSNGEHELAAEPGAALRDGFTVLRTGPQGVLVRPPDGREPRWLPPPSPPSLP